MGCEKFQSAPGNLFQLTVHGGDQLLFVLVEHGPPLLLRLQIDEVFGVEEAGGVGAVVGTADLADHLRYFRETTPGSRAPGSSRACLRVGPVLGASVARAQIAPSSRCGRNSEPMTPLPIR